MQVLQTGVACKQGVQFGTPRQPALFHVEGCLPTGLSDASPALRLRETFDGLLAELLGLYERLLAENTELRASKTCDASPFDLSSSSVLNKRELASELDVANNAGALRSPSLEFSPDICCIDARPDIGDEDTPRLSKHSHSIGQRSGTKQALETNDVNKALLRWESFVINLLKVEISTYHEVRTCWETVTKTGSLSPHETSIALSDLMLDHDRGVLARMGTRARLTVKDPLVANSLIRPHSVRVRDRLLQMCPNKLVMTPTCARRVVWNGGCLILMLYDAVFLSIGLYQFLQSPVLDSIQIASQIFWTADIAMSFLTAVYVEGELKMGLGIIARRYVASWFSFDLAIVVLPWVDILAGSNESLKTFTSSPRLLKFARYVRLARLTKMQGLMDVLLLERSFSFAGLIVIQSTKFFAVMVLWVHMCACIWYAIGSANHLGWVYQGGYAGDGAAYRYLLSLHWAVAQLQGSTDIAPGELLEERIFAMFAVFVSIIMLATCMSRLTNIMMELRAKGIKSQQVRRVNEYLNENNVSMDLSLKVKTYMAAFVKAESIETEDRDNEVVSLLPLALKRMVVKEIRAPKIMGSVVFATIADIHPRFIERVCNDVLRNEYSSPGELLWGHADRCHSMHFVMAGKMTYVKYNSLLSSLARQGSSSKDLSKANMFPTCLKIGSSLAEAALWTVWVHMGDFNSLHHSATFVLDVHQLHEIAVAYTQLHVMMGNHAHRMVTFLNSVPLVEKSDLTTSMQLVQADRQKHRELRKPRSFR